MKFGRSSRQAHSDPCSSLRTRRRPGRVRIFRSLPATRKSAATGAPIAYATGPGLAAGANRVDQPRAVAHTQFGILGRRRLHRSGRRRLESRRDTVGTLAAAVTSTTIQGHGGVGKSSLAREYARRFQDHYDYIWWIPAQEADTLIGSLAALAVKLDPTIEEDKSKKEPSDRARYAVEAAGRQAGAMKESQQTRPWLLIFDNCEDPSLVNDGIPQAGAHCLITSRLQAWPPGMGQIDLTVLPPASSSLLLATLSGRAVMTISSTLPAHLTACRSRSTTPLPCCDRMRFLAPGISRTSWLNT